jgi:ABC-type amino acid transport substrate-binding protein
MLAPRRQRAVHSEPHRSLLPWLRCRPRHSRQRVPTAALPIAALALAASLLLTACATSGGGASGDFTPRVKDTLTVATAQIPDPGLWYGTFAHPTGGFEYALAQAFAKRFGLAKVKVIEVPFHELVRGHLGGADLALSDITITEERAEHLDFSTGYLEAPPAIVVHPGTKVPDVKAARELHWAVQHDTTLKEALEDQIEPTTKPLLFELQSEKLAAFEDGRVNAVLLDLPIALAYARESPRKFAVAAQLSGEAELGVALPSGSDNVEAVDSAIRALKAEGEIDRLGKRWLHASLEEGSAPGVPELRTEE